MFPLLRVAIQTTKDSLFDYLPPVNFQDFGSLAPGIRVSVPLRNSTRIGVITALVTHTDIDISKLKHAHEILDKTPVFTENSLKLIQWSSQYYHCSLGEVFNAAMPTWLRKGKPYSIDEPVDKKIDSSAGFISLTLNPEQQAALDKISDSLGKFQTFLIDGVTGSGKTEIYMQVIAKVLAQKRQALVLVPEIGLTPQMLERFQTRFQVPITVLHSAVSEKQRYLAWRNAKEATASIIIGTRSAVFIPIHNPGVFIIDEEHDNSFKQQDSFRYNARDLIIMRGNIEQCPVILGSATPSLESFHNSQTGRYQKLRLTRRAGNAKPPSMHYIDIRHKKLDEGLSSQLIHALRNNLETKGQTLLFLNRRGFAPVLMCFDCGFVANCKHCDARLTLHYQANKLRCHHCEATLIKPDQCPSCQSLNLHPLGVGTERLEAALARHFPEAGIVRIDRDTTRKKGSLQKAVEQVKTGAANILLGTQMLAKGHHFPNVTLVAVLDIDSALFSTDFRSLERLGQLLTQVAGRAGREEQLGSCLLQTCHPEHPLLKILLEQGFSHFAEQLLMERRRAALPPFSFQALIRSSAKNNERALGFLQGLKTSAQMMQAAPTTMPTTKTGNSKSSNFQNEHKHKKEVSIKTLGPISAPMERKAGSFHAQLLLQSNDRGQLHQLIKKLILKAKSHPLKNCVRWSMDVDPIDMF